MTGAALAGLAGLALVDSTSFGTLVLPLMMLLAPQVRTRNLVVYLLTIAGFYFLVGLALLAGARAAVTAIGPALETTPAYLVQLVLGVGLIVLSFVIDPKLVAKRRARRGLSPKQPGLWRRRVLGPEATLGTVIGVALLAGLVEVASMLPYLAAVGILVAAALPAGTQVAILAGYVLVMVAPALVLFGLRRTAGTRIEPRLQRIEAWLERTTGGATAWIVGILGFLLAADAIGALVSR
jgi:Sap, sulfolipid-1-addressing protein